MSCDKGAPRHTEPNGVGKANLRHNRVLSIIPMLTEAPCVEAPIDTSARFASTVNSSLELVYQRVRKLQLCTATVNGSLEMEPLLIFSCGLVGQGGGGKVVRNAAKNSYVLAAPVRPALLLHAFIPMPHHGTFPKVHGLWPQTTCDALCKPHALWPRRRLPFSCPRRSGNRRTLVVRRRPAMVGWRTKMQISPMQNSPAALRPA